jgi:hypothetical protein
MKVLFLDDTCVLEQSENGLALYRIDGKEMDDESIEEETTKMIYSISRTFGQREAGNNKIEVKSGESVTIITDIDEK